MKESRGKRKTSSRRRHRSGKGTKKDEPFVLTNSPFAGIPPDLVNEAMLRLAQTAIDDLPDLMARLEALLRRIFPPHLIGVLAAYGLRVGVGPDGVVDKSLLSGVDQHHIELLQALALRIPWEEWGRDAASSADFIEAREAIQAVASAFYQRRLFQTQQAKDDAEKARLVLMEAVRMHTQMVRNWGYFSDVMRISRDLYAPLDEALKAHHGFSATELFTAVHGVIGLVESRFNARWEMLRKSLRGDTPQRVIRRYFALSPDVDGDPEELIASLGPGVTRDKARAILLEHADKFVAVRLIVTADEVANATGLGLKCCKAALNFISMEPGDLAATDPENIFLDNPVWTAPIVRMDDTYLCVVPQTAFSFVHDIVRRMAKEAGAKDVLAKRRGAFLEERVRALLEVALPGAQILANTKWSVGPNRYETDCVAKLDRTIVIVEAKSAALSALGLRGQPDRLKRHVDDLIQAPAKQSNRLEGLIFAAKDGDENARASLAAFGEGFWDADRIVRLSVTLDDFSVLSSMDGVMKRAGWIDADLELPATLNLADFEVAVDILRSPIRFIHYFSERSRVQRALSIVADELDFLGFYLRTGFNIWSIEERKATLMLTGASAQLDSYYQSRDAGVSLPKPTPRVAPYFANLLWGIEARKRANWLTIGVDLLRGLGYEEQVQLEKMLDRLRASVVKKWRDPDHECSVMVTPPPIRDTALVFYVFPPQLNDTRFKTMDVLISQALEQTGRSRCVIVARNTERWDDPYRFVGIGFAGDERTSQEAKAEPADQET